MSQGPTSNVSERLPLVVNFTGQSGPRELTFRRDFRIGRVEPIDVCIPDEYVSRVHAEARWVNGNWWLTDLNSSNGIFVDNVRVPQVPVQEKLTVRLGVQGPTVSFTARKPPPPPQALTATTRPVEPGSQTAVVAHYVERFLAKDKGQPVGEHTMLVHKAIAQVQKRQASRYRFVIAGVVAVAGIFAAYAFYLHLESEKQRAAAQDLFYTMKTMDVNIANVERLVGESNNETAKAEALRYQEQRKALQENYEKYLVALKLYNQNLTEPQKLILRVARIFGECELNMPPDFTSEVERYIKMWQSSGRYARDIKIAKENGYNATIPQALLAQDLPPQFFYLAMQESDFNPLISGPQTRVGYAKGMWQFIPSTAVKYGLKIGPLVDLPRPDPGDDRHHYDRATIAAAKYLKDLYSSDAQASGLLVMACYNWGEGYVLPLVQKMPANPKDRNFWKLLATLKEKKIPEETYNYVFYIVSAAVIGENPRLFGFDFDNPLETSGSK
jgi:membrane-bound lytic murein transglycosylase D